MLMLNLDHNSPLPIHRQVRDQICLAITNGTLKPGEKLPTQEEFRDRWDVHIETVLRAMRALERDGLIRSIRGQGRFVVDAPPSLSKAERNRQIQSETKSYLAALAPLRVTLAEAVTAIRDIWKGRSTR